METETKATHTDFIVEVGDTTATSPGFTPDHITRKVVIRHTPTERDYATTFTYNPTVGRFSKKDRARVMVPDPYHEHSFPRTRSVKMNDVRYILRLVADDAATAENAPTFDDFADDLGFFPIESRAEYRRAEDAYDGCQKAAAFFRSCGVDVFELLDDLSEAGVE